jgi:hypothetical protein
MLIINVECIAGVPKRNYRRDASVRLSVLMQVPLFATSHNSYRKTLLVDQPHAGGDHIMSVNFYSLT